MECRLVHILSSNNHAMFIGMIEGTYISQALLLDGKPDFNKLTPLLWTTHMREYVKVGEVIGKSPNSGNALKTTR